MPISSPFDSQLSLVYGAHPLYIEMKDKGRKPWDPTLPNDMQKAHSSISLPDPIRTALVVRNGLAWSTKKELTVSANEFQILNNPVNLTAQYRDLIQHHVAQRVALFFQQAILCYKTPFYFDIAHTSDQILSARTLDVKSETTLKTSIKYQAAHSSTIPGLKACFRYEHLQSLKDPMKKPRYFSFLKGTHLDVLSNSTVGLPDFVNKVDTLIDGQSSNPKELRGIAIDLINKVAIAALTPTNATHQFLAAFKEKLETRPSKSKAITDEKIAVIQIYLEQIAQMQAQAAIPATIEGTHPFFDPLLNVDMRMEKPEDIPVIREIVYKRKIEIIRESQFLEAKIQQIINQYIPTADKDNEHMVRLCLTYCSRWEPDLLHVLEKLFCISIEAIEKNPGQSNSLDNQYRANTKVYENILREIRLVVRNFRKMEQCFQAGLLKDFRTRLRNYRQNDLADRVIKVITDEVNAEMSKASPNYCEVAELNGLPTSPSTISRLENSRIHITGGYLTPENQRRKALTLTYAKVISKALEIQPGHFYCSLFASAE